VACSRHALRLFRTGLFELGANSSRASERAHA